MKKNLGNADRFIRVVLAITFGAVYFSGVVTGTLGVVLIAVGAVLALTSIVNFCPLYALVGIKTCTTKQV